MAAQRFRRTVAHDVAAEVAARRLDGAVCVSRWRRKTFGKNLEVEDKGFHLRLHFFPLGRNDAGSLGANRTLIGDFGPGLFDDFETFADSRYAHHVTAVAIGSGARGNVKFKFVVAG